MSDQIWYDHTLMRWGMLSALVVCCAGLGLLSLPMAGGQPVADAGTVVVLHIPDQIITPTVAEYLAARIRRAEADHAAAVIIELNTPGGLMQATQSIVETILNATVPVAVYVTPQGARAASAGMFITLAAHVAAMAPSTRIGAAHPVTITGDSPDKDDGFDLEKFKERLRGKGRKGAEQEKQGRKGEEKEKAQDTKTGVMGGKIIQDTVAWVESIAKSRGRNATWAVEAVVDSRSSTVEEAMRLGVIDLIAPDRAALLAAMEGREVMLGKTAHTVRVAGAQVVEVPMNARERFLQTIANPNIAYLLMMLGFYGLLFEITHPGSWVPGIAGACCLLLAFYAMQTLPTNYVGLAFILLAMVLFFAETQVASYGFLALGGVACLVVGSAMLIDSPSEALRVSWSVILPVAGTTVVIVGGLAWLVARAQHRHVDVGMEGMIGRVAEVTRAIAPAAEGGKVMIDGEIWDAVAEAPIATGERVEIVGMEEGMKLRVRRS